MIDREELQQIEQRAKAAKRAVDTVEVHTDGGLFGEIPLSLAAQLFPAAVSSARDVPRLLAEVKRLSPASYLIGPEACTEGDCDEEEPADGQDCSHIREAVATFDDVKRAEVLGEVVQSARKRLTEFSGSKREDATARDFAVELLADIDHALEAMEAAESAGWVH